MNKAVFLDRDGVLNVELGDYVYLQKDFVIAPGVREGLIALKKAGFLLVVVTNQGGIAKGLYQADVVKQFHALLQIESENSLDALYFSPHHNDYSKSLMRKPDSLMFEKAIAKFKIDPKLSWMVGDAERDLVAAAKVGISNKILIPTLKERDSALANYVAKDFTAAVKFILQQADISA